MYHFLSCQVELCSVTPCHDVWIQLNSWDSYQHGKAYIYLTFFHCKRQFLAHYNTRCNPDRGASNWAGTERIVGFLSTWLSWKVRTFVLNEGIQFSIHFYVWIGTTHTCHFAIQTLEHLAYQYDCCKKQSLTNVLTLKWIIYLAYKCVSWILSLYSKMYLVKVIQNLCIRVWNTFFTEKPAMFSLNASHDNFQWWKVILFFKWRNIHRNRSNHSCTITHL